MVATSTARADDWATPGLDAAHSRLSAERSGAAFADGRWAATNAGGARVLASPLVADGLVVAVDLDGTVRALRADDGQLAWRASIGAPVQGTPAIARGRVFVPTLANSVVALRLADGTHVWTHDAGGMMLSSPAPVEGDIVIAVGVPGTCVVRLSGADGTAIWQSPRVMEQFGNSSPAIGGGLAVVGASGGHYYAFDVATGAPRWDYRADGIVNLAAPVIANGRVYMAGGGNSHRVHAVDAATGTAVAGWPIDLPTPEPDVAGTRLARQRAVSSFASIGGLLVLQTRLDDGLDTNGDGAVDKTLSRELVLALDASTGGIAWQQSRARAEIADSNQVPKFFVCPTPAGFGTDGGGPLVAVASSLEATVRVLDAATGVERWRQDVGGPALASPVFANGRLHLAAMNGTVEGVLSSANHPPGAPILAGGERPMDAGNVVLRWLPAVDPDAELPSYELRIDTDGEVLESWQQQLVLSAGSTSAAITASLVPGTTYTFRVRARDARGAFSPWSAPQTFSTVENPAVSVNGTPVPSLASAIAIAQPGEVISLGAGVYTLADTVHVKGGLSIQGAGPGRTIFDATGLAVGLSIDGTASGQATKIDGLTVKGAATCVQIPSGAFSVRLGHLIARDCRLDGVAVADGGEAAIVNATLVGNGNGVHAIGAATIRNSLLSGNAIALLAEGTGTLASSFDNVFGNGSDYRGLSAGTGDFSAAVAFASAEARDFHLAVAQPSTDRGDPADSPAAEPAPNGGRINLGAFGGTAEAETTALSTAVGGSPGAPTPTGNPAFSHETPTGADGGCAIAGRAPIQWLPLALGTAIVALARRRARARRR
jgi:outer membrane protein assembly factor BamB